MAALCRRSCPAVRKPPSKTTAFWAEEWARIGAGLRGLLNGALGRLDAGTLDSLIADTLRAEDFDPDEF